MQRQWKRFVWVVSGFTATLVATPVLASLESIGTNGIDALRLQEAPYNLTGSKIAIGQVEIGRPSFFGLDKAAATNPAVRLMGVFFRNNLAAANDYVDGHAGNVASVMVSRDKALPGVAPGAMLYSSAAGFIERGGQAEECLASQTIAQQNGQQVRAINFSFGEPLQNDPRPNAVLDGNALLTQCIDWSANVHNVLYVIAGNQGGGGIPIPTDNFNGVNIANSRQVNGVFRKIDFSNLGSEPQVVIGRRPDSESNVGPRRSISLAAPGTNIQMLNPDGSETRATGTSFAAPHVTASVALIQEFASRQIASRAPNWSLDARRSEVTKAILMNAADKLQDAGDNLRLGMTRDVVDQRERNWLQSDAYRDRAIPLDNEMGTGHLNVYRAYEQFRPGQWSDAAPVPAIGWDFRTVGTGGESPQYRDYVIQEPLEANSFVSATLAWNRQVTLNDENGNQLYDIGENFTDRGLNNLDIYLMRAEDDNVEDSIWSSVSQVDSVEHIFHPVPQAGRYKIRVVFRDRVNEATQPYALAWWTAVDR